MIKILIIIATVLNTVVLSAQGKSVSSARTSTTKTDGNLVSRNSVSVNSNDKAYSLRGEFDVENYAQIKSLLEENLENAYKDASGTTLNWTKQEHNKVAYSIILTGSKLKMNIYRESVSKKTFEQLKMLGDRLSAIISK